MRHGQVQLPKLKYLERIIAFPTPFCLGPTVTRAPTHNASYSAGPTRQDPRFVLHGKVPEHNSLRGGQSQTKSGQNITNSSCCVWCTFSGPDIMLTASCPFSSQMLYGVGITIITTHSCWGHSGYSKVGTRTKAGWLPVQVLPIT